MIPLRHAERAEDVAAAVAELRNVLDGNLEADNVRALEARGGPYIDGRALRPRTVPLDALALPHPALFERGYNAGFYFNESIGAFTTTSATYADLITPNLSFVCHRDGLLMIDTSVDVFTTVASADVGLRVELDDSTYGPNANGRIIQLSVTEEYVEVGFQSLIPVARGRHVITAIQWKRNAGLGTLTTDAKSQSQVLAMLVGV